MTLTPRAPTPAERRRRLRRLGFARRTAPLVRAGGARLVRRWVRARLAPTAAAAVPPGFFVPLDWVEAARGGLPARTLPTAVVRTLLADWVDCAGTMRNTIDHYLGAGDWSGLLRSASDHPVTAEARELRCAGLDYTRTPTYAALLRAIAAGERPVRQGRELHARADVDAYFERFVRLYRSVASHGLVAHAALDRAGLRFNRDRGLGVALDANGRFHRLPGANHRWAIAEVLGITEVPVEVRLLHVACADALTVGAWR